MSKPLFIVFKNTTINVADISRAQVRSDLSYNDLGWELIVHFRGVDEFRRFSFETQKEAQEAYKDFNGLILDSLTEIPR